MYAIQHLLETTPVKFESCHCVRYAGLLLLLPFLLGSGLLSYKSHYHELDKGYYFIDFIILFLAFMYLARIKNPEQLKNISPGEFGKLMGVDRVPESKCLRSKLKQICRQNKSKQWNMDLANTWSTSEENELYYIDGHVQVYSGYNARLGKKHVARQKICLPGIQEFWVNNNDGLPYFYVTGEVNEKLLEMLSEQIIPKLLHEIQPRYTETELSEDPDLPVFTIVFDREGYSPSFFRRIWDDYRIAVLTYRKNVKDRWDDMEFSSYTIESDGIKGEMKLKEKDIELNNVRMREIRKLSGDGHQTSIITTNKKLPIELIATNMFLRWTQENYFKYMRKDYDFDRVLQYLVEQIDSDFIVSNPEYNNLSYYIKKVREKISRRKAKLYELIEENVNDTLEKTPSQLKRQALENEELAVLKSHESELIMQRNLIPSRIRIKDMPEKMKYNRLHLESKHFQNIIKMICFRAESSCANVLYEFYKKHKNEKRELVKSIINSRGDILYDEKNETLTVCLYSLSSTRMNFALDKLCELLNDTESYYPGVNIRLIYKIAK